MIRQIVVLVLVILPALVAAEPRRARDLGVPFEGTPGPDNAITDVAGVRVGHTTVIRGRGAEAVRTGVTAVLPNARLESVFAASFVLNGNGEATGLELVDEWGLLLSPIMLTNTVSVGTVHDAVIQWSLDHESLAHPAYLPVVAETWDGRLNDIHGSHVSARHVRSALAAAASGPVAEGNVGGGTGMVCYGFKGGIGTASRALGESDGGFVVGALVQANFGRREHLRVAGLPVGAQITDVRPQIRAAPPIPADGSVIVVVATDAPMLPHQLERVARRAVLGLARTGTTGSTHSGDIVLAFSTEIPGPADATGRRQAEFLAETAVDAVFTATVQSVEEAVVNALVAAETMTGVHGNTVHELPEDELVEILARHRRLAHAPSAATSTP